MAILQIKSAYLWVKLRLASILKWLVRNFFQVLGGSLVLFGVEWHSHFMAMGGAFILGVASQEVGAHAEHKRLMKERHEVLKNRQELETWKTWLGY